MKPQTLHTLIVDIVERMPDWTLESPHPDGSTDQRHVISNDDMSIYLGPDWEKKDRLNVGVWEWPDYTVWNERGEKSVKTVTPRDLDPIEKLPFITVAMNQGPDAIVSEINRRFMPEYKRVFSRCLEKSIEIMTEQFEPRDGLWSEACRTMGVSSKYDEVTVNTKRGRFEIHKNACSIGLVMDVGLDTLKLIYEALNSTDEA